MKIFIKRYMLKINLSYLTNILIKLFFIVLIPITIILSFLYSSNFNLLEHSYTLIKGNSFFYDDESRSFIDGNYDESFESAVKKTTEVGDSGIEA